MTNEKNMRPRDELGHEALPPCSVTKPDEAGDRVITNERGDWRWVTRVNDADDVWLPGPRYTHLKVSIEGLTPERVEWLLITSRESREEWIAATLAGAKSIAPAARTTTTAFCTCDNPALPCPPGQGCRAPREPALRIDHDRSSPAALSTAGLVDGLGTSAPVRAKVIGTGDNAEEMRASLIAHEEAEKARAQADRVVEGFLKGLVKADGAQRVEAASPAVDDFGADVGKVLDDVRAMLLAKNAAYGDSALSPLRVFSKSDPAEQIRVRIDDKLSRLARGSQAGEDTIGDLLGYLVLLRVAEMRAKRRADGGTT